MRGPNRNHSFPDAAIGIVVRCFGCVVTCDKAQADLYTTNAASLEWKVDSADELFLAEIVSDVDAKFGSRFNVFETLRANRELSSFPHETVHRCPLGRCLDPRSPFSAVGNPNRTSRRLSEHGSANFRIAC